MPIAKPDNARTLRDVPVVIAVIANDEGNSLSIAGYTVPPAGTLVLNSDQSFTYTPAAGFFGTDGFAYTVRDQLGGTAQGEVTIVVARPNSTPGAVSDSAGVMTGGNVDIAVLANDNDPEGDPLAIIGVDAPSHGTIAVQPDQSIRYTPQSGFDGIDSFTYTVGDGAGAISTANVTVAVTVPNAPPLARPDQATTMEGMAVTIDALANDNDPEGGPISLSGVSLPGHGGLTLTPDLRFVYTPDASFVGPDSFSYAIRDDQGAVSAGLVTVDVARQNSPPVATKDIATSTGQPVLVDPLANDSDPDGDALQLTALTLPVKGQIALNPNGKVTYTPPTGFTGVDSFTYQVSDGTVVSEGQVEVSVTAPAIPTYANGYRYRRRVVVPPQTTAVETASDFVLLVRESDTWLKSVAAGGRMQHLQGFDLRFELENGTKLDHELERYDAGTGSLLAWVRVPSWQLSSQLRLVLYYGKSGLTATEANPASVWRGYLAVLDARTGVDRSGNNRSLTPTGIGTGTLLGDAGSYSGASIASRADALFLSGAGALTVQALVAPTAAMVGSSHGVLAQGPMNGTDAAAGLVLQYLATTADGTRNAIHFKLTCGDGAAFVVSGADAQRAQRQLLHGVWRQGETARLFLDGNELQPSAASVARTGLTAMPSGGLYLGAGARDPATGGWSGVIDEVRFAATAFSPARIATEARNLGTTQALYGLGGEDEAGQTDAAPVAIPLFVTSSDGGSIDIDVAASAYDADGPGLPRISAAGSPAQGVATVVGGKVRYTPFAGYTGPDQFTYAIENLGKRASSLIVVTVRGATTTYAKYPPAPVTTRRVPEDYTTIQLAYAACNPGDHISLANGVYPGNFTFSRSFGSNPVIFKSRAVNGAVFSGQLNVTGTGHWFHEIKTTFQGAGDFASSAAVRVSGSYFWFTRCWSDSRHGIWMELTTHHAWIGWCRFTGKNTVGSSCSHVYLDLPLVRRWSTIDDGPHHIYIYRNFFHDVSSSAGSEDHHIYLGPSKVTLADIGQVPECYIEYNLIYNDGTGRCRARGIYLKRGAIMRFNDIDLPQGAGSEGFRVSRGGELYGNTIRGKNDLNINGGTATEFAKVYGNAIGGTLYLWAGSYNGTAADPSVQHQAADYCVLAGNRKLGSGALSVVIGEHADSLDNSADQGGVTNHVTVYGGGFAHSITRLAGWYDPATCDAAARAGWGPLGPVTPITLSPIDVGQELSDQR